MNISKVSVEDMAKAREARAENQKAIISRTKKPLVCFTMNIPGPYKVYPLVRVAFTEGIGRIYDSLGKPALALTGGDAATGYEAYFVYDMPASELKRAAVAIEERDSLGRIFDIDVIGTDHVKLERGKTRGCIVCGGAASVCARDRKHGLDSITEHVNGAMMSFAAPVFARAAEEALREELDFTPKPGLVDLANSGSHGDMNHDTFVRSIDAIAPFLEDFVMCGAARGEDALPELREIGIDAEKAMFEATGGINTHLGAIFSLGLALGGVGDVLIRGGDILRSASRYVQNERLETASYAYAEAKNGFPVAHLAKEALEHGGKLSSLLCAMSRLEDGNLLRRGGRDGLDFVKSEANRILLLPQEQMLSETVKLDGELIRRHLSPGGSADMLALAIFLSKAERLLGCVFGRAGEETED